MKNILWQKPKGMLRNTTNCRDIMMPKSFRIDQYPFDGQLEYRLLQDHEEFLSWPVVYFLENAKQQEAYVGETTDMVNRLKTHLKTPEKKRLSKVSLILSDLFNKSATLDIESNLIRYVAADGQFSLQNGNLGISDHQFYQKKEVYWDLFRDIWDELRSIGVVRHSLDYIDNSDLFKYSPYKSLSGDQIKGLKMILQCLLDDVAKISLIHGGAGTGKSILAIFLFKLLKTDLSDFNRADFDEEDEELYELVEQVRAKYGQLEMALVIPMQSFRKTIAKVFKGIKGLSTTMVIGPADLIKKQYDLVIVDEGHRLRQRKNLSSYYSAFDRASAILGLDKYNTSELDWVQRQSHKAVIFYDEFQSVKPSDVNKQAFLDLQAKDSTRIERLHSQFRVKGGLQYMEFIHHVFSDQTNRPKKPFVNRYYDLRLYDNVDDLVETIRQKDKTEGLSRMVAGFAWEWISKKDKKAYDIVIGDTQLRWNSTAIDWVNSPNAPNEVGCIHTTQGYDLNYTGLIIGPELDYDFETRSFVVYKDRYKDKNGKNSISDSEVLKNYVLNIYRTILFRGIKGTYIYACNENMRHYLQHYISTEQIGEAVSELNFSIVRKPSLDKPTIPFYDLEIAAGSFSELQQNDTMQYLELESNMDYDPKRYFACKVVGESMNKIIPNGSICLFEQYQGGSRNGLICLVESSDFVDREFGSNYTIKEYRSKKTVTDEGWSHEEITLHPRSNIATFEPIRLRDEETVDLRVIGVFVKVLV